MHKIKDKIPFKGLYIQEKLFNKFLKEAFSQNHSTLC